MNKFISLISKNYSLILMSVVFILLPTIGLIIIKIVEKKHKSEEFIFSGKKLSKSISYKIYKIFESFLLTRRYLEKIKLRYEMLCPEDNYKTIKKTIRTVIMVLIVNIFGVGIIYFRNPTVYNAAISIFFVIVSSREVVDGVVKGLEKTLLVNLDVFLTNVRHHFNRRHMVDEALTDARAESSYMIKIHTQKILKVLESPKKKRHIEKRNYLSSVSNKHLQMLMSLCVSFIDVGDKIINNTPLFITNIQLLRSDIHDEQIIRKEADHRFFGMMAAVVLPVFSYEWSKKWIINITPSASEFYNGIYGTVYIIIAFVSTIVCYIMVCEFKEAHSYTNKDYIVLKSISSIKWINKLLNNYENNNNQKIKKYKTLLYRVGENISAKQFMLKRMLYFCTVMIACLLTFITMHIVNKNDLTTSDNTLTELVGISNDKQVEKVSEIVLKYVNLYKDQFVNEEKIKEQIKKEGAFRNTILLDSVTKEVVARITKYQNEYLHWYEMIVCVAGAIIGYWFPYWMLLYRKSVIKSKMEQEVMQFQTKIMMIMYFDHTTVLDVLETLESFAVIFKQPLRECINEYAYGDIKALQVLRKKVDFVPFQRIVDNLISADKIGVQQAFDEIAMERKNFREIKNQETQIALDNKVNYGTLIAYIPGVLAVGYILIPIIIYLYTGYQTYQQVMQSIY